MRALWWSASQNQIAGLSNSRNFSSLGMMWELQFGDSQSEAARDTLGLKAAVTLPVPQLDVDRHAAGLAWQLATSECTCCRLSTMPVLHHCLHCCGLDLAWKLHHGDRQKHVAAARDKAQGIY